MAVPIVIYKRKPKQHSWARWMNNRTKRKNQNNLFSFVGPTGSGKTWSAISVAEIMSKLSGVPFGEENIVFTLRELMILINSGKLKRGSIIIFDEPQISISSRDFQSKANKTFNYLVSTFRHRNFSLFFCCPFESLLDKNTRRLFHGRFETMSINPNKKTCRLKPRFIEYSDWKAQPYTKRLIVRVLLGQGQSRNEKLDYWDVPQPSKDLIKLYEEKKMAFTNRLNENIQYELTQYEESGKSITNERKGRVDGRKPLTEKQEKTMKTLAHHTFFEAEKILGITLSTIHEHKRLAMKKGYTLEEFK